MVALMLYGAVWLAGMYYLFSHMTGLEALGAFILFGVTTLWKKDKEDEVSK